MSYPTPTPRSSPVLQEKPAMGTLGSDDPEIGGEFDVVSPEDITAAAAAAVDDLVKKAGTQLGSGAAYGGRVAAVGGGLSLSMVGTQISALSKYTFTSVVSGPAPYLALTFIIAYLWKCQRTPKELTKSRDELERLIEQFNALGGDLRAQQAAQATILAGHQRVQAEVLEGLRSREKYVVDQSRERVAALEKILKEREAHYSRLYTLSQVDHASGQIEHVIVVDQLSSAVLKSLKGIADEDFELLQNELNALREVVTSNCGNQEREIITVKATVDAAFSTLASSEKQEDLKALRKAIECYLAKFDLFQREDELKTLRQKFATVLGKLSLPDEQGQLNALLEAIESYHKAVAPLKGEFDLLTNEIERLKLETSRSIDKFAAQFDVGAPSKIEEIEFKGDNSVVEAFENLCEEIEKYLAELEDSQQPLASGSVSLSSTPQSTLGMPLVLGLPKLSEGQGASNLREIPVQLGIVKALISQIGQSNQKHLQILFAAVSEQLKQQKLLDPVDGKKFQPPPPTDEGLNRDS